MIAHKLQAEACGPSGSGHPRAHRPRARRPAAQGRHGGPDLPASGGPPAVRPRAGPGDGPSLCAPSRCPRRTAELAHGDELRIGDSPSASVTRRAIHPAASCSKARGWRSAATLLFQGSIGRTTARRRLRILGEEHRARVGLRCPIFDHRVQRAWTETTVGRERRANPSSPAPTAFG